MCSLCVLQPTPSSPSSTATGSCHSTNDGNEDGDVDNEDDAMEDADDAMEDEGGKEEQLKVLFATHSLTGYPITQCGSAIQYQSASVSASSNLHKHYSI